MSIVAEAKSNSLIVSASTSNMEMIAGLIAQLDHSEIVGAQVKVVPLVHRKANEVMGLLKPRVEELNRIREVPAESQATIAADPGRNTLMIVGTATDIREIETLIAAVDIEIPVENDFSVSTVAIVGLKNGLAEEMATVLNELIEAEQANAAGGGGSGANAATGPLVRKLLIRKPDGTMLPELDLDKPIKILPEKGTNSLIIYSTEKNNDALRRSRVCSTRCRKARRSTCDHSPSTTPRPSRSRRC